MISFNYETDFKLSNENQIESWIESIIIAENYKVGELNFIFCDDDYIHKINVEFLKHDTFTDIISFDYKVGKKLHGDIYISVERVLDNAKDFKVNFQEELQRVIIHGILHFCGYKDKTKKDAHLMRLKENEALELLQEIN